MSLTWDCEKQGLYREEEGAEVEHHPCHPLLSAGPGAGAKALPRGGKAQNIT